MISVEEFKRADLRVGQIVDAAALPGSDRLLRLTVELGGEQRTVVGGLARAFAPEQLRGLQVIVVANMAPAVIRGVRSEGMLLGVACDDPAALALLTVNRPVANGSPVA